MTWPIRHSPIWAKLALIAALIPLLGCESQGTSPSTSGPGAAPPVVAAALGEQARELAVARFAAARLRAIRKSAQRRPRVKRRLSRRAVASGRLRHRSPRPR